MENTNESYDIVWPEKSAMAIEEYIFARYYMYQNVYLHKTTRGLEKLLVAMWKRADRLRNDGVDVNAVPVLDEFWNSKNASPNQYLNIEEFTVLSQIQLWKNHSDHTLADLSSRFLNRECFKVVDPPPVENELVPDYTNWENKVHEVLKSKGYKVPEMYCLKDTLKGKYRTPYIPEKEEDEQSSQTAIRVIVNGQQSPVEISKYLPRLQAVTKPMQDAVKYYVPADVKNEVLKINNS